MQKLSEQMRLGAALGVGLSGLCAIVFLCQAPTPQPISLSDNKIVFERLQIGQTQSARLCIRNNQKTTLTITKVVTSCGCTSAFVEKDEIGPGDTAELVVEVNAAISTNTGIIAEITVQTDAAANSSKFVVPVYVVRVEGAVCIPEFIELGRIFRNDLPTERFLTVKNTGSSESVLTVAVVSDHSDVHVNEIAAAIGSNQRTFRVVVGKSIGKGDLFAKLKVQGVDESGQVILDKVISVAGTVNE